MEIQGKIALVTGAGSGIGRATALRLAAEGAAVVLADVDEAGLRETVGQIYDEVVVGQQLSGPAADCYDWILADVTSESDVRGMIDHTESIYGGLDILHNNAGVITGPPRWPDTEPERWIRMLDINLRGVILGTQLALPAMRKRGGGAIVNTASMAGIGAGFPPSPVYAASKGGVVLFTASLAPLKDEANIRVNCVCPGVVDTPMFRSGRENTPEADRQLAALEAIIIQPEEIADAVVSLIRDDSLAGRALMVRNGMPRELYRLPAYPPIARP